MVKVGFTTKGIIVIQAPWYEPYMLTREEALDLVVNLCVALDKAWPGEDHLNENVYGK